MSEVAAQAAGGDEPPRLPSVHERAAAKLGIRLDFDRGAVSDFAPRVPELFHARHAPVDAAYQRLLYGVAHAYRPDHLAAIEEAFDLPHPRWSNGSQAECIALLDRMRFPATRAITQLRAVPELTLPVISHYIHFFHHVYPIYDQDTCKGLERLGVPVPYTKVRDADAYGLYVAAIETLKEILPFGCFPETNLSLQRITQAAVAEYGGL